MLIPSWAIGVAFILIAIQIGRAISARAGTPRRDAKNADMEAELGELRQNLEATQHRVAELEERVDFAERLLTKHREGDRLGA